MPRNSQDAQIRDWAALLKEVRKNEKELSGVAPFAAALERAHTEALCGRVLRDGLLTATRGATRQLNEAFAAGNDAAIQLRNFVRGVLGFRNQKLARYGVKPKPRRAARKKLPVM